MSLSRKTILIIVSTFIALVFVVGVVSELILLKSFTDLEHSVVGEHMQNLLKEIGETFSEVDAVSRDYDKLVRTEGPEAINRLSTDSFANRHIDIVACFEPTGRLIASRTVDFHNRRGFPLTSDHLADLRSAAIHVSRGTDSTLTGMVTIGTTSVQATIRRQGAVILLVGRFFDEQEVQRIRELSRTDIEVRTTGEPLPSDFAQALETLASDSGLTTRVLKDNRIAAYSALNDIYGKPAALIRLSEKRVLFEQGKTSIAYIMFVLGVTGVVFCTVMLVFIREAVLKRMALLGRRVNEISASHDLTARLTTDGNDELEGLAHSINNMLESLASAESRLKESEERYRELFDRAPDSIFIIGLEGDEAGRIIAANRASAEQHGYTIEELCAKSIGELNAPGTDQTSQEMTSRIADGEWVTFESWHIRSDGSRFPIEVHAGPFKVGGRHYALGFDRDITIRKLVEETDRMYLEKIHQLNSELDRKANELAAANRELESFNYSVSHDMRGPLTRISGYCQLIMGDDDDLDPRFSSYINRIYDSSCWLNEMIEAMLKLSQLSRAALFPSRIDLSTMVGESLRELRLEEPQRQVEITIAPAVEAVGDRDLLKILLGNLVGNAWKYTSRTRDARIEFGMLAGTEIPTYFVRDNGAGFDMKDSTRLFNVFTRLHEPGQFAGSGIGLATAQRIVTRHGGRIWAEGAPGNGAVFFFTLQPQTDAGS